MRVLSTSGNYVSVAERRWPLADLDFPKQHVQGHALIDLTGTASGASRAATYMRLYRENPWVNAAVRTIAWGLSRSYLGVYELQADGQRIRHRHDLPREGRGRLPAGVLLDKKLNGAAGRIGPQRRMRSTLTDYLIFGNALWVDDPDLQTFWRVPWKRVIVHEGDAVPILFYEVRGIKQSRRFVPEQVVHFCAGDDPDNVIGMSPMEALKHTLALHEALQRHLVKFFENAARPSGNVKLQPGANRETIELVREQFRQLYTAPENAGKVVVSTGDFQPITAGHDHAQIIELAKLSREEIAAVYRIPTPVLGILDRAIRSNVKELREQHVRDVIGAWGPTLEDEIMAQVIEPSEALRHHFVEFDLEAHLRPDLEGTAIAFKSLETTMTTNERRRKLNLPDLPYEEANTVAVTPGATYLGLESTKAQPEVPDEDNEFDEEDEEER